MPSLPIHCRLAVLALCGLLAATSARADLADATERLAACSACHGEQGEGVRGAEYYPHLAGKPAGYLFEQLQNFRDGRRVNAQMTWLVGSMDDAYMAAIATHYAAMPPRTRPADTGAETLTEAMRQTAVRLVEEGDPARDVPPCTACHGKALTGLEPAIPALVALPADYIIAQLGNWRSGVRHAQPPDCMAEVARDLSPGDIRAIAVWLSRQVAADGAGPAPAGSFLPPRACGAMPHGEAP
ncbi:MAG: cytochrome c4 [Xanthomonadales bacterium]|nr:cytochrome c4 [Xanthomonadales bacterium]